MPEIRNALKLTRSKSLDTLPESVPKLRDEFLQTTNIVGFGYIYHSRVRAEQIFWILSMILFLCLLARDVYELTNTYINNPSIVKVCSFTICQ